MGKQLVTQYLGASLIETLPLGLSKRPAMGGGLKGAVETFSPSSRRRLQKRLAKIRIEEILKSRFVTLTYPDEFPEPQKVKRDLHTITRRFLRKYPGVCGLWRLEYKPRLSGKNSGKVAPHLHFLVFRVEWVDFKWLGQAWYEVVDSGDPAHLMAGTSVEGVDSFKRAAQYISKYASKEWDFKVEGSGRRWGTFGDIEQVQAKTSAHVVESSNTAKLARVLDGLRKAEVRARKRVKGRSIKWSRKRKNFVSQKSSWFVDVDLIEKHFGDLLGLSPEDIENLKAWG